MSGLYFHHNQNTLHYPQVAFRRTRVDGRISLALKRKQGLRLEPAFPPIFCSTIDVTDAMCVSPATSYKCCLVSHFLLSWLKGSHHTKSLPLPNTGSNAPSLPPSALPMNFMYKQIGTHRNSQNQHQLWRCMTLCKCHPQIGGEDSIYQHQSLQ